MTRCVNTKQSRKFITTRTKVSIKPDGDNAMTYPSEF
jgi:hypothetical protein